MATHWVTFGEPPTLGGLIVELQHFVQQHPNPTDRERDVQVHTDADGRVLSFTVTDAE